MNPRMITPEFERLSKVLYLKINLDAIKENPKYWESLSHEKQVELHAIKKELDEKYAIDDSLTQAVNQTTEEAVLEVLE